MLITILTTGSRGDTQPFIALGLELQRHGHKVRLAASEGLGGFVGGYGLEHHPVTGDITKIVGSAAAEKALKADNPLKFFTSLNNPELMSYMIKMQRDYEEACRGADAIVYHPGVAQAHFIARKAGVPGILASPFPLVPTSEYPALLFYDMPRLGKAFNRLTHTIFEQGFWMAIKPGVKGYLKQKGESAGALKNPFPLQRALGAPIVVSCSGYVFPKAEDHPANVHHTGFWFLDGETGWEPSNELLEFLDAGEPPVYAGFGSIGDPEGAAETTAMVIKAIGRSGRRGILATGWNGMIKPDRIPDGIHVIEGAPHSWLFPRMAAVIHHGGAGTTAAGLRAGVPSVIVPYCNDQFAWGRRITELGVGSTVRRKGMTVDSLAKALGSALDDGVAKAAKAMGERVRAENGASKAAGIILDHIAGNRR